MCTNVSTLVHLYDSILVFRPSTGPTTLRFVYRCHLKSYPPMESNNKKSSFTRAKGPMMPLRFVLTSWHYTEPHPTLVRSPDRMYEVALTEPVVTAGKEAAQSFMDCILAAQTGTHAQEDVAAPVVESYSDDTKQKPQPSVKTVNKSSADTQNEIVHVLPHLGVVGKTKVKEIEEIGGTQLTKRYSTLQSEIVKAVESTFEDTLQTSYFNSTNGLKTAMFKVVEQGLGKVE